MTPYYQRDGVTIHHGDCLDAMRAMAAGSVSAVVTDPPYELGFMGKSWDRSGVAFDPETWRACLDVLRPGGFLLAFGGSRTVHRIACAIEDAGFELRDTIMYLYGSGFPKSLDVSKAIDRQRTEDVEACAAVARFVVAGMKAGRLTRNDVNAHFGHSVKGSGACQQWTTTIADRAIKPRVPTWEQWEKLKAFVELSDDMDAEVWRLNGRKGKPSDDYETRPAAEYASAPGMRKSWTNGVGWTGTASKGGGAVREAAKRWQGWGTALKPAHEPIVVARKPLDGTVAENVQKHECGGLNIDAARVGDRWPANVVTDGIVEPWARYFYTAKASKADRGEGNAHPTVKPTALMEWLVKLVAPHGGAVLDPFAGSGTTGVACVRLGVAFIGMEQDERYCEIAARRLDAELDARAEKLFA